MKYGLDNLQQEVIKAYLCLFPYEEPVITISDINDKLNSDNLKQAYRKAAKQNHPDYGGDSSKMQEINEANEILTNYLKQRDSKNNYQEQQVIVSPEERDKRLNILNQAFKVRQHEINLKYLDNLRKIAHTYLSDKVKRYFEFNQMRNNEFYQVKKKYQNIKDQILTIDDETFKKNVEDFSEMSYKSIKATYSFIKEELKSSLEDLTKSESDIENAIKSEGEMYKNKIRDISMLITYNALTDEGLSDEDRLIICEVYYNNLIPSTNNYATEISQLNQYISFLDTADLFSQNNFSFLEEIENIIYSEKSKKIIREFTIEYKEDRKMITNNINELYLELQSKLKEQITNVMKTLQLLRLSINPQVLMHLKSDYNKIMDDSSSENVILLDFLKREYDVLKEHFGERILKNYQEESSFSINTEFNVEKKRI